MRLYSNIMMKKYFLSIRALHFVDVYPQTSALMKLHHGQLSKPHDFGPINIDKKLNYSVEF